MPLVEPKGLEEVREFMEHELGDYSRYHWTIENPAENEFYVTIKDEYEKEEDVELHFSYEDDKLSLDMYEGNYEEVKWWDNTVRYFWMKFTRWA